MKVYRCNGCGNILIVANDGNVIPNCCGSEMELLFANTTDGAFEKHVPVVKCQDDKVKIKVGEVEHPMDENHYIQMIILETNKGLYLKHLNPKDDPEVCFKICKDEKPLIAYEYCNLHSLFMKDIHCEEE